jgi:DNA-binding SARP family transcriptional activator
MAALTAAEGQQAHSWARVARLLATMASTDDAMLSETVAAIGSVRPWVLAFVAELLARRLHRLDSSATRQVVVASRMFPGRWRAALRDVLQHGPDVSRIASAEVLEEVGEKEDVPRLRAVARAYKSSGRYTKLGKSLARRTADPVLVEDQGRVTIAIGNRFVAGSEVRRKILALLCFLLAKPGFSATRDQVLDALWPDLDPSVAANSLNQTTYFLRRVFEPGYIEECSPGYLQHDSDVVWLDDKLIQSRARLCNDFIDGLPARPEPDDVVRLVRMYQGRFALDFEYEEWAAAYRDGLHAAYLEIVERRVQDDLATGHYDRGIKLARRALEVDPDADQIEATLLRLYQVTGAYSAAAEQYGHYAYVSRHVLGVEPPPLDRIGNVPY